LDYIYSELLLKVADDSIQDAIFEANDAFAQYVYAGRDYLRNNKVGKKTIKELIRFYLHNKKKGVIRQLSKQDHIHMLVLIMTCLESEVLTKDKTKKFFK